MTFDFVRNKGNFEVNIENVCIDFTNRPKILVTTTRVKSNKFEVLISKLKQLIQF